MAARVRGQDPALRFADNGTVYLDPEREVQPDALLFWDPPRGPGARLRPDGYLEGAPVLVAEVVASSASYELHDKKDAYRRAGVQEYVVWRVLDRQIDWFRLHGDEYVPMQPDAHGLIASDVLLGLRLSLAAMPAGDAVGVLASIGVSIA